MKFKLFFGLIPLIAISAVAEPFRVGALLPLTGNVAEYGLAIRNAITLAKEDHAEELKDVEFVFEDVMNDPKMAVTAFQKFRTVNKIDLAYTWGVALCKTIAPLSEQSHIPTVGQCIDEESSRGKRYFLRFMNSNTDYVAALIGDLSARGFKKLGVVLADSPYTEEFYRALERLAVGSSELQIVDRYPVSEMNFRSSVAKLRTGNYQALGLFLFAGQISEFAKQSREQNLALPIFGTNLFESQSEIANSAGALVGAVFPAIQLREEFISRYEKRFGNASQLTFGGPAYEFARSVGRIVSSGEGKGGEAVIEQFRRIKDEPGVAAGPYSFAETKEAGMFIRFPVVVKRVGH